MCEYWRGLGWSKVNIVSKARHTNITALIISASKMGIMTFYSNDLRHLYYNKSSGFTYLMDPEEHLDVGLPDD